MQGRLSRRTQWAGLALGAALLMAGCAGPTVQHSQSSNGGPHLGRRRDRFARLVRELGLPLSRHDPELSGDGQDAALHGRRRQWPAWPFEPARRASIGRTRPTATAACCSPRRSRSIRPRAGVIIVFFHGNNATLSRDVIARQQIVRQLADSGLNAVLVAPQLAVDAQDSSAGRFWSSGGFASFLGEAQSKLGDLYPNARGAFRRMPIVIVAYSGGYLPAAYSLAVGGDQGRVRGLVLLDALYGERDKFVSWAEGPGRSAFFVSAYSTSSRAGNDADPRELEAAGVPTVSGLPAQLTPRRRRLRRRGLGRSQRLRHFGLGRRALARHLLPHWRVALRSIVGVKMLHELGQIVALERAFRDRVPNRLRPVSWISRRWPVAAEKPGRRGW